MFLMRKVQLFITLVLLTLYSHAQSDSLQVARAALQDQLYAVAQSHAEQLLASDAHTTQALLILLPALAEQAKYTELLKRLENTPEQLLQTLPAGAVAYWRTLALLHSNCPAEAAQSATAALAAGGEYRAPLRRLCARALHKSGELDAALTLFAEIDQNTTNLVERSDNALEWALALHRARRNAEALAVLEKQAELTTTTESLHYGTLLRGQILLRTGSTQDGAGLLEQLAMNPRAAEAARVQAMIEMGTLALGNSQTNEAVAYVRSAWECAKKSETRRAAGFFLGDLLCATAATIDEGEELVKALVREFPEATSSMQAQLKLADSLLQAQRPERAAKEYRIFLETYPASSLDATVLQGRGWSLLQLGRFAEAGLAFQRAARLSTNATVQAECTFKQADTLLADERYAEAAAIYREVAEKYPTDTLAARALYQSANALARAGQTKEAGAAYRKVVATFPQRDVAPQALLSLAELQNNSGDADNAINTYTAVLKAYAQHPAHVNALLERGKIHYRAYRFEMAMQDFAAVVERGPQARDEAHFLSTLCLYGLGRDEEARAAAAAFLLAFPDSSRLPDMTLWLGKFDFNRGHYDDARRFFVDYTTRWPTQRWADAALLWAARAAFAANEFTGVIELVAQLARDYPQSGRLTDSLLIQADALIELARFDEAVLLLDQTLANTTNKELLHTALLRKGDALFAMGAGNSARYREALTTYRQLLQDENPTPAFALQLNFKVARCLEKLKLDNEAIDQYYAEVIVRYLSGRSQGVWYDDSSTTLFVRAAFAVAELYEQKNQAQQAVQVLQRVVQAGVSGADEARKRIERLRSRRSGE